MDYEEHEKRMLKITACKGTLEAQFGKAMEATNMSKNCSDECCFSYFF